MAWTTDDLTTIRAAIASGVQTVRYADGRQVTYQSLDALIAAEKVIAAAVTVAEEASNGTTRRKFASYSGGFC